VVLGAEGGLEEGVGGLEEGVGDSEEGEGGLAAEGGGALEAVPLVAGAGAGSEEAGSAVFNGPRAFCPCSCSLRASRADGM
jgi:hypothetical protein